MGNEDYNKSWGILLENADACEMLKQSLKCCTYLVICRISRDFFGVSNIINSSKYQTAHFLLFQLYQFKIQNGFDKGVSKSYQADFMLRI